MEELEGEEVTVIAHCLLNPLTRVRGLRPIVLCPAGPVVQLPCPEFLYMGPERWAVTRNQLDVPQFRRFCRTLIAPLADTLEMLDRRGARLSIMGVAGSPSCGVATTSEGYGGGLVDRAQHEHVHVPGRGIFMQELTAELERRRVRFRCDEAGGADEYC